MPVILRWLLRLGPTNPIAVRLVQNGSRRSRHMYIRSIYLGVLIVVLLWSLLLNASAGTLSYRDLASAGATSFQWIAYLQITLICILAPVFMGGAIAQEASPRTWEVLLTTPLGATEIVLGNLFGRLFFVLALLAASLPLFALTQFFGGVPGSAIFASYLVAGCAALLVGAIAIALSVSRLVGKRAFFVFYVCVVSYLAVTIAVDLYLRRSGLGAPTPAGNDGVTWMTGLNPFLALTALLNPTTYARWPEGSQTGLASWMLETPVRFWCMGSAVVSLFSMIVSVVTVRAGGLQSLGQGTAGVPLWRRLFGFGAAGGEHRAPRAVWHNPIAWREAASRNASLGKTVARYSFLAIGGLFGLGIIYLFHTGGLNASEFRFIMMATVFGELAVIALVAINTSATAISREREDGTLDLLLTTPITAGSYLTGKLRGLIAYLMPILLVPLGTLGIAGLYVLVGGLGRAGGVDVPSANPNVTGGTPAILPEALLIAPLVVIPFMAFCVMVGLQWSLKSRGTLGSVVASVGVVGVVTGIVGLCSWNAGPGVPIIGPALAAISPASLVYAIVTPDEAMGSTIGRGGLAGARVSLLIGAVIAAALYAAVCYGIHSNMVRTFDMTVRKLAGNK